MIPAPTAPLVDTHAHLTDRRYARDLGETLDRAREAGVVAFVVVGYDLPSSVASVDLAARHPDIWAVVGLHPHNAKDATPSLFAEIERLASAPRVVAIGECGLDYYRDLSPRAKQREVFKAQLRIAAEQSLPVVVHSRDAMEETLGMLGEEHAREPGGVMHCFDSSAADAVRTVDLGFYVSFAGPITYRKDSTLRSAAAAVPGEFILVETDCPYLSPDGHRGERNEPAHVRAMAEAVAQVRGVRFEEMARQTSSNAQRLFKLT
ncbi:MAG: TatD family hydrolase [Chloroflexota bacterium]